MAMAEDLDIGMNFNQNMNNSETKNINNMDVNNAEDDDDDFDEDLLSPEIIATLSKCDVCKGSFLNELDLRLHREQVHRITT